MSRKQSKKSIIDEEKFLSSCDKYKANDDIFFKPLVGDKISYGKIRYFSKGEKDIYAIVVNEETGSFQTIRYDDIIENPPESLKKKMIARLSRIKKKKKETSK